MRTPSKLVIVRGLRRKLFAYADCPAAARAVVRLGTKDPRGSGAELGAQDRG